MDSDEMLKAIKADDLVYRPQIAEMLGVTDHQAEPIVHSESFPDKPYKADGSEFAYPAWRRSEVEAWIAKRNELLAKTEQRARHRAIEDKEGRSKRR